MKLELTEVELRLLKLALYQMPDSYSAPALRNLRQKVESSIRNPVAVISSFDISDDGKGFGILAEDTGEHKIVTMPLSEAERDPIHDAFMNDDSVNKMGSFEMRFVKVKKQNSDG